MLSEVAAYTSLNPFQWTGVTLSNTQPRYKSSISSVGTNTAFGTDPLCDDAPFIFRGCVIQVTTFREVAPPEVSRRRHIVLSYGSITNVQT